ncbi:hypothetical protein A0H81_14562 [Grifola frondosa]|uniref:Uncharacterized protein n=1 Tax=Grifola frondosa TaxID=5627 RepID=A0A1C7LN36_GRIFR|nr:hypothetical protein A0H81_14562 [Grifola frondosa]
MQPPPVPIMAIMQSADTCPKGYELNSQTCETSAATVAGEHPIRSTGRRQWPAAESRFMNMAPQVQVQPHIVCHSILNVGFPELHLSKAPRMLHTVSAHAASMRCMVAFPLGSSYLLQVDPEYIEPPWLPHGAMASSLCKFLPRVSWDPCATCGLAPNAALAQMGSGVARELGGYPCFR